MHWSTRQVLVLRILGVGAAAGFLGQMLWHRALRAEIADLRTANQTLPQLRSDTLALRKAAAELARLRRDDIELAAVRFEAQALQTRIEAAALLPPTKPTAVPRPAMPRTERRFTIESTGSPRVRSRTVPDYPGHLRAAGIGGVVDIALTINREGDVADAWIVNSARPEFESCVLAAAQSWKYEQASRAGESAEHTIVVPITFDAQKGRVSIGRAQPVPVPGPPRPPPPPPPPPDWF